jgi:hypothetical protein
VTFRKGCAFCEDEKERSKEALVGHVFTRNSKGPRKQPGTGT